MNPALTSTPSLAFTPPDAPAVPSHAEARRQMLRGQEKEFAALRRLDTGQRLREMAFFGALFLGGMAVNYLGCRLAPGGWPVALRVLGTLGTAIAINTFILHMHEGMHQTLFANRFWNRWASVALGATFCLSFTSYRIMHLRHHQYLGDVRDPDDYRNYVRNRCVLWVMHYLRLVVGPYLYIVMIPFLAARHGSPADRQHILAEYLALAPFYLALFFIAPSGVLVSLWLIPLIIAAHLTAIRGLTQHGITNAQDPFLASRSIQANPLVAFCLLNENYHLEHHLFPEIPSYNLKEAHRLIWPRLPRAVTGKSYLAFIFKFLAATVKLDETPIGFTELLGWEV